MGEAAEVPLAHDDLVEEAAGFGGRGRMGSVVFLPKLLEILLELPGEDVSFGKDSGPEVGIDDSGFSFGRDGAVGFASVLARRSDLFLRAHGRGPFGEHCSRRGWGDSA